MSWGGTALYDIPNNLNTAPFMPRRYGIKHWPAKRTMPMDGWFFSMMRFPYVNSPGFAERLPMFDIYGKMKEPPVKEPLKVQRQEAKNVG